MGQPQLPATMPPLATIPQGAQRADAILTGIMAGMGQFEKIAPKFMQMMQAPPAGITPQEQEILTGRPSQALHERFLRMQQQAMAFSNGQPVTPQFTSELESFYVDMFAFMESITALMAKAPAGQLPPGALPGVLPPMGGQPGMPAPQGGLPPPGMPGGGGMPPAPGQGGYAGGAGLPPMLAPLGAPPAPQAGPPGGAMPSLGAPAPPPCGGAAAAPPSFGLGGRGAAPGGGMGGAGDPNRANQLFDSVQRLMGEFEAGLPRFERATQRAATVMNQLTPTEQQLLSGQISQSLHERFLRIQQQAQAFGTNNVQMADPRFVAFLAEVEQFVADFTAHNQGISAAVAKVEGLAPGGAGGGLPPGMAAGMPAGMPGAIPPSLP